MDLTAHAVRQQPGTADLSIVSERDPYADRARAEVRIWTLEATMGTWAELPSHGRHAPSRVFGHRGGTTGREPADPVPTSAQTVLSGGGPGTTPQRSARASTSSRPRPDSASVAECCGHGIRSPRVSVTSMRRMPPTTYSNSRKSRPETRP